jgi:hypothetical protein
MERSSTTGRGAGCCWPPEHAHSRPRHLRATISAIRSDCALRSVSGGMHSLVDRDTASVRRTRRPAAGCNGSASSASRPGGRFVGVAPQPVEHRINPLAGLLAERASAGSNADSLARRRRLAPSPRARGPRSSRTARRRCRRCGRGSPTCAPSSRGSATPGSTSSEFAATTFDEAHMRCQRPDLPVGRRDVALADGKRRQPAGVEPRGARLAPWPSLTGRCSDR